MEAILLAGKQLQRLGIKQDCELRSMQSATVQSSLLRKLIYVVSSPAVVDNAAKLLSALNKEGAVQGDLLDILITSSDRFPEVCILSGNSYCLMLLSLCYVLCITQLLIFNLDLLFMNQLFSDDVVFHNSVVLFAMHSLLKLAKQF